MRSILTEREGLGRVMREMASRILGLALVGSICLRTAHPEKKKLSRRNNATARSGEETSCGIEQERKGKKNSNQTLILVVKGVGRRRWGWKASVVLVVVWRRGRRSARPHAAPASSKKRPSRNGFDACYEAAWNGIYEEDKEGRRGADKRRDEIGRLGLDGRWSCCK